MAKNVQMVRFGTAASALYVGPIGQIIMDTGLNALRVQDGVTPGGFITMIGNNNLADLVNIPTARSNLGLGSAALLDEADFDPAGSAATAAANSFAIANNFSEVATPATARTNIGLGLASVVGHASLALGGATIGANALAVTGTALVTGAATVTGAFTGNSTATFSGLVRTSSGGFLDTSAQGFQATGFGITQTFSPGSIILAAGSPTSFSVIARSGGVILNDGATSWTAISERSKKKDISSIENAYEAIMGHQAGLGLYKEEIDDAKKRPFLFVEDAIKHWPYAVQNTPALIAEKNYYEGRVVLEEDHIQEDETIVAAGTVIEEGKLVHKEGAIIREAMDTLSYTDYIPLIVAALQEQYQINKDLRDRIAKLEGK